MSRHLLSQGCNQSRASGLPKLTQDRSDLVLHGRFRLLQHHGDLLVAITRAEQCKHAALRIGQQLRRFGWKQTPAVRSWLREETDITNSLLLLRHCEGVLALCPKQSRKMVREIASSPKCGSSHACLRTVQAMTERCYFLLFQAITLFCICSTCPGI